MDQAPSDSDAYVMHPAGAMRKGTGWAASATIGAVSLLVYLLLAPPVSGDKDTSEFTLVLATNGVAHPTGYPLYTLLGHAFVRLARLLGAPWPFAANAWSAVGGALAISLLHALTVRLGSGPGGPGLTLPWSLVPVLVLGLDPLWTLETTLAEVYSWHVAWALGACLMFASTTRRIAAEAARAKESDLLRSAAAWGVLCGVGAAHHLTSVFVAAPLSVGLAIAVARAGRWRWGLAGAALGAGLVPLASYGIIAWRAFHPAAVQWPVLEPSWSGVLRHVMGAQYRPLIGHFAPAGAQPEYLAAYIYPYLALGLGSLLLLARGARDPAEKLILRSLGAAGLVSTAGAFSYGAFDPASYFLAGLALGLAAVGPLGAGLLDRWRAAPLMRRMATAAFAIALAVLAVPWARTGLERRKVFVRFDGLVRSMWASIPFASGIVVWRDDMSYRLREYQILRGEKRGLSVVNPNQLTHSLPRRCFQAEHGFDPLDGIEAGIADEIDRALASAPERDSLLRGVGDRIVQNINRHSPLPVVLFLPESSSVRLLRKPG